MTTPYRTPLGWIGEMVAFPVVAVAGIALRVLTAICWIWTAVLGYQDNGIFGAIIAAATPVISQFFFVMRSHTITGMWVSNYTLAVLSIPVLYAIGFVAGCFVVWGEQAQLEAASKKWRQQEAAETNSAAG